MIFTLVSAAQDILQEFLQEIQEEAEKKSKEEEERKLKAEEAKYKGTPVTMETFHEWKEKFLREMEEENLQLKETVSQGKGPTGQSGRLGTWGED